MPTTDQTEDTLLRIGFTLENEGGGLANTYRFQTASGRSVDVPLEQSNRYRHSNIAGHGSIYIHKVVGSDCAVLVANGPYLDRLLAAGVIATASGVATNRTPHEPAYRGDALWRALIVLARETA